MKKYHANNYVNMEENTIDKITDVKILAGKRCCIYDARKDEKEEISGMSAEGTGRFCI